MVTSLLTSPTVSKASKHAYTTSFLSKMGLCRAIFSIVVQTLYFYKSFSDSLNNNGTQIVNKWDINRVQLKVCTGEAKAGRFVGLANCYAVIVLADNTILAVNSMVAFRPQSANRWHYAMLIICCRSSAGRASAQTSLGHEFKSHLWQVFFACLWHTRHMPELFYRLRGQLKYRTALGETDV